MGRVKHDLFRYHLYLKENSNALTTEEADEIWGSILEGSDQNDEDVVSFYEELLERAAAYAAIRAKWLLMDIETRKKEDAGRTNAHNRFINSVDNLAAFLKMEGKDVEWYHTLGNNRKRVGDFACYLALIYGLAAR